MATGSEAKSNTGDRNGGVEMRARFLEMSVRRRLQEGRELSVAPPSPIPAQRLTGGVFWLMTWLRRLAWCSETSAELDSSTKWLGDDWDELSDEQRAGLEKEITELLDLYDETCG